MKIYFIGSHGTGKTTLSRYTSEKHNLPLLNEMARTVLAEKELQIDSLRSNIDIANNYQSEVFFRQFEEEKRYENFVSDRSVIDALAYTAQHTTITANLAAEPEFKTYLDTLKEEDSIVFFVRPSKATLKNDGVREQLNWDGIVSIDAMIKFILEMFSIRYFQINTDSMQERTRIIDAVLSMR